MNRSERRRWERRRPAATTDRAGELAKIDADIAEMEGKLVEAEAMIAALEKERDGLRTALQVARGGVR